MRPIDIIRMGAAARSTVLDTQTVTTGTSGAVSVLRGFNTLGTNYGSITDGTSNMFAGANIKELLWDQNSGADQIRFTVQGNKTNTGWTKMAINGVAFNRSAASFLVSGNTGWTWTSTGYTAATQPFGAASSTITVVFT